MSLWPFSYHNFVYRSYNGRKGVLMPRLKDVLHTTGAAGAVVVDAQRAIKAERRAKQQAHDDACRQAESTAGELRDACRVALGDATVDRLVSQRRFWALAWGTNVPGLLRKIKSASYDTKAYVSAYEIVTGRECRGIPAHVYRNAKAMS